VSEALRKRLDKIEEEIKKERFLQNILFLSNSSDKKFYFLGDAFENVQNREEALKNTSKIFGANKGQEILGS